MRLGRKRRPVFLSDSRNLTLNFFMLLLARSQQNSEIANVITTLVRQRAPGTAVCSSAAQLRHQQIVPHLLLEDLGGTPQSIFERNITGYGSENVHKDKINYIYHAEEESIVGTAASHL